MSFLEGPVIVAAIDARRGELFYAFYRHVPGGVQRVTEPEVGSPDDLASELFASGEECLLVGDGAWRYEDLFSGLLRAELAEKGLAYPSAASLVQLFEHGPPSLVIIRGERRVELYSVAREHAAIESPELFAVRSRERRKVVVP